VQQTDVTIDTHQESLEEKSLEEESSEASKSDELDQNNTVEYDNERSTEMQAI
jgi:hypothetical protein